MKSLKEIALDYKVDILALPKPIYKCNDCKDMGVIETAENSGKLCECTQRKRLEAILNMIPKDTFSTYIIKNAEQQQALNLATKFADNFNFNSSLMFCGNIGTAKTHLAYATARRIIEIQFKKNRVVLVEAPSFSDLLVELKEHSPKIKDYKNCDLLILDDLYKEFNKKNFSHAEISLEIADLVNYRYLRRFKCSTIITSELNYSQLKTLDDSTATKILDMCDSGSNVFEFVETKNYRERKL